MPTDSAVSALPAFDGKMEDVKIHDKELSKEEIGTMTGKPEPGLMPMQDEINKLIIGELSPICIEHDLQPRYNVGSKLFGSYRKYLGDICVKCGKVVNASRK